MKKGFEDEEIIIGIQQKSNTTSKKNKKKKGAQKAPKDKKNSNASKKVHKKNNVRSFEGYQRTAKLKKLKVFFLLSLIIVAIILVMLSSIFNIKFIKVENNSIISEEEIINLADIGSEQNLFKLRKNVVIANIKKNAYIESVEISRKLPNTLEIKVKERTRKYMLQFADSYIYINNQGYMLEISTEKLDLPIITGFKTDLSNVKAGDRLEVDDLKKLEMVIKIVETANSNGIGSLISKVDISDDKEYMVELASENKKAYLGDCSNLNTRMLHLKTIIEQEKGNAGTAYIDMNLNTSRAYFRPE
mgnify:FL=1